jgi:polysaccharide deacetylase family protein (PEP-CTERM system associated)
VRVSHLPSRTSFFESRILSMLNALTIDVEEYFHPNALDGVVEPSEWERLPHRVERNTNRVLEILAEFDTRATFFVLGWVAERWPGLVREIARRGHEIACHGYAHRLAYRLGPEGFRADVERAHKVLQDVTGALVAGFRAASYSIVDESLWALDVLIDLGFAYDSSIFPIRHDIYGIPGFSRFPIRVERPGGEILEIPPSTVRLLGRNWPTAGGGYFRLAPYWLTRLALGHLNRREGVPAMVYLHPWELDVDQPRLAVGALTRLRQYANLGATERRLRHLLAEFRLAPIRDVFVGRRRRRRLGRAARLAPAGGIAVDGVRALEVRLVAPDGRLVARSSHAFVLRVPLVQARRAVVHRDRTQPEVLEAARQVVVLAPPEFEEFVVAADEMVE